MIVHACWMECDGCQGDAQFPGHLDHDNVRDLRADAKSAGWVRRKGRDLCPDCAKASVHNEQTPGDQA